MPNYVILADRKDKKDLDLYKSEPWMYLGARFGVKDDLTWIDRLKEEGIAVCTEGGVDLTKGSEIREKVKTTTLYIFLPGRQDPYGVRTGADGLLEVSEEPVVILDFRGLPKKPEEPVYQNPRTAFAELDRLPEDISREGGELKIHTPKYEEPPEDTIVLTEEEKKLMEPLEKPPALPPLPDYHGYLPEGEENQLDVIPEALRPPRPEPMNGFEIFWDSLVSIFVKDGSERGRRFKTEQARYDRAPEEYRQWAENYNTTLGLRNRARRKQEQYETQKQEQERFMSEDNPRYMAYVAQEERKRQITEREQGLQQELRAGICTYRKALRKYETKMDVYRLAYRKRLEERPVMARADISKNGLTLDNIGGYAEILGRKLQGRSPKDVEDREIAEYLFARNIGEAIRIATEGNLDPEKLSKYMKLSEKQDQGRLSAPEEKILATLHSDYRKEGSMLEDFRDPVRREATIEVMLRSPAFQEVRAALGDRPLDPRAIVAAGRQASAREKERQVESLRKELVEKLGQQPVGEETRDLLMKIALMEEVRTDEKLKTLTDPLKKNRRFREFLSWPEVDFRAVETRRDQLLEQDPELRNRLQVKLKAGRKLSGKEAELAAALKTLKARDRILQEHPEIDRFVTKHQGQQMTGEEIASHLKTPVKEQVAFFLQ